MSDTESTQSNQSNQREENIEDLDENTDFDNEEEINSNSENEEENEEENNYLYNNNQYLNNSINNFIFSNLFTNISNQNPPNLNILDLATQYSFGINNNFQNNFYPIILNNILEDIENEYLEEVLQTSLNESNSIQRTEEPIDFSFQIYKESKVEKVEEIETKKDCSICLIDFEENDQVTKTNCNHIFHHSCITEWSRYKKDCPICREKL